MADGVPLENSRVKGLVVVKPIVFGNKSQYFGKKRETDGHTHWWKIYVKPYNENEDMSAYVKKVHFKLHESYANPQRICMKPPYEVSETGWGEFEIIIKIYFADPTERPVTLYHLLKLFHADAHLQPQQQVPRKELVSEYYDEIIFQDPTQLMHKMLISNKTLPTSEKQDTNWRAKEERTLEAVSNARKRVSEEISQVKERLKRHKNAIQTLRDEITKTEESKGITT
eukprot:Seg765.3 transcript_id=Seg765.3/GoldUCD/mRNA.D3Y31 product="YEATS domain-containing protein 4" protein_id=Seg765.3/GoldUCD/D3Y31